MGAAPALPGGDHVFVVPAHGDSPFLDACLASLGAQTQPSPVVVATATPSPATETACARHGAGLRVNPDGGGIGRDWNFALAQADARYVTLAHQDDLYRPDFTARTLATFARRPEGALVFTGAEHVDADGRGRPDKLSAVKGLITGAALLGAEVAGPLRRRLLLSLGNPVHCSSVTFDLARSSSGFRFAEDFRSNLDWDAWWRLHRQGERLPLRPRGAGRPPLPRRDRDHDRALADGARRAEDLRMFETVWPRPIAHALALAYAGGY